MMSIAENIIKFRELVPEDVKIVAVSKFHPAAAISEAYNAGQRIFGESRVQEFLLKEKELPQDIEWHFIGHLQTNKVKQIIGKTAMIESVDSERLLQLIDRESQKAGVNTNVLLQVHVAEEETKFGFYPDEIRKFFESGGDKDIKALNICGIMGMATNTDDQNKIRRDFQKLYDIFSEIKNNQDLNLPYFQTLSMGMSGDWQLAVEEGSNSVRIGSAIFGERSY